tara:strand:- start:349 stop:1416 length:1068 start_codon:yes stop_codon:yes gene_type:complete
MNNTIDGIYFDGLSSASIKTLILLDNSKGQLCLQTEDGNSMIWYLSDLQFEVYDNLLEIRNKSNLNAILKVDDKSFARKFYQAMKKRKAIDIHSRLLNLGFLKISMITVCVLVSISLMYLYMLPPIAEKSANLLPESFDNYIGKMVMQTIIEESTIDIEKTKHLQKFAAELNLGNTKPIEFTVIKSNKVNAFALPNGQIVIYTAILDQMKSYDQLVALLGHEVSHVNNRHSIKILTRNLAGYMMISLVFSDLNGIMSVLAENAQQLRSLSYSREFEEEADEQALKILVDNNINPYGIINLFEILEKGSKSSVPEIMSTHPLTSDRKENMHKIISASDYVVKTNYELINIFESLKN